MKKILPLFILSILGLQVHAQQLNNLTGQAIPEKVKKATLFTTTGQEISFKEILNQNKDSVLYIDFWASWCGPCRREMPHSKTLQKKMQGKKVAFLYLSTDISDENWQKGLQSIKMPGQHYRIDEKSKPLFQDFFHILGIPYYVIIGKNSIIEDPKARWPREDKIIQDLQKALNR